MKMDSGQLTITMKHSCDSQECFMVMVSCHDKKTLFSEKCHVT